MKKDKKWLKEQIERLSYTPKGLDENSSIISKNWVLNFIDQLEEPETLNEEWINEHSKCYTMENSVEISDLKNLLLPQPKKPVIPKFVANWIESYRKKTLAELINDVVYSSDEDSQCFRRWFHEEMGFESNYSEFLSRAWLDGYEVEKEKLYTVCFEDDKNVYRTGIFLYKDGEVVNSGNAMQNYDKEDNESHLTEKEIKDYDERF